MSSITSKILSRNSCFIIFDYPRDSRALRNELLCCVSEQVSADSIAAIFFLDTAIYLYFTSFACVRTLMRDGLSIRNRRYPVFYYYNVFTGLNIPPSVSSNVVVDQLNRYGNVKEVEILPFCSDQPRFQHVLGSERRLFVEVKCDDPNDTIPCEITFSLNAKDLITIVNHCMLCNVNGHNTNDCNTRWATQGVNSNESEIQVRTENSSPNHPTDDSGTSMGVLPVEAGSSGNDAYMNSSNNQNLPSSSSFAFQDRNDSGYGSVPSAEQKAVNLLNGLLPGPSTSNILVVAENQNEVVKNEVSQPEVPSRSTSKKGKKFKCRTCHYSAKTSVLLQSHNCEHNVQDPYTCITCHKTFALEVSLKHHRIRAHRTI